MLLLRVYLQGVAQEGSPPFLFYSRGCFLRSSCTALPDIPNGWPAHRSKSLVSKEAWLPRNAL